MALTKLNFTGQGVLPTTSMPTDSVIQVKQVVIPKETITTASATFVSVGHSLAITPSATSSRILIEVRGGTAHCPYVDQWCISTIYRGSTNLSKARHSRGSLLGKMARDNHQDKENRSDHDKRICCKLVTFNIPSSKITQKKTVTQGELL
jgi:hypothetical protein